MRKGLRTARGAERKNTPLAFFSNATSERARLAAAAAATRAADDARSARRPLCSAVVRRAPGGGRSRTASPDELHTRARRGEGRATVAADTRARIILLQPAPPLEAKGRGGWRRKKLGPPTLSLLPSAPPKPPGGGRSRDRRSGRRRDRSSFCLFGRRRVEERERELLPSRFRHAFRALLAPVSRPRSRPARLYRADPASRCASLLRTAAISRAVGKGFGADGEEHVPQQRLIVGRNAAAVVVDWRMIRASVVESSESCSWVKRGGV